MPTSRSSRPWILPLLALGFLSPALHAGDLDPVALPAPDTRGGRPLMEALNNRQTIKTIGSKPVPLEHLSNLLWAAFGINRPDSGKRTAPSAMNSREMDLYVMLAGGTYLYDAGKHRLSPVLDRDLRAEASGGRKEYLQAPVQLVYIADYARLNPKLLSKKEVYSAAHAGFIGQNVYLFCASSGLATVFRAGVDRPALRKALNLREDQAILFAQTVGVPDAKAGGKSSSK